MVHVEPQKGADLGYHDKNIYGVLYTVSHTLLSRKKAAKEPNIGTVTEPFHTGAPGYNQE